MHCTTIFNSPARQHSPQLPNATRTHHNSPVSAVSVSEETGVPVHVNNIKEMYQAVVVDPEDTVIEHLRALGIEVEELAELRSPVNRVQLRVVTLPSQMRPRVLQHEQPLALVQ